MKTTVRFFALLTVYWFALLPNGAFADTHPAATCENKTGQTDVQAAVNLCSSGDTVTVPKGSCTWNSTLSITKKIILQGMGSGQTVITDAVSSGPLISYISSTEPIEIFGFIFNQGSNSSSVIKIETSSIHDIIYGVKIHDNAFTNCRPCFQTLYGGIYGVVYDNTFSGGNIQQDVGGDTAPWTEISAGFGDSNVLYFEDNSFTINDTATGSSGGARYCYRYNTFTYNGSSALSPWFDAHGNQPGIRTATMQVELYGNKMIDDNNKLSYLFDQRGGMAMVFYNLTNNSSTKNGVNIRDEYDDAINPPAFSPSGQPQHASNTYIWSNYTASGLMPTTFQYAHGTATGGGNNYLDDSNAKFCGTAGNNCPCSVGSCEKLAYGVRIISGTGAGQFRKVSVFTQNRITVTANWTTNPDATSTYDVRQTCCDTIDENAQFWTMRSTGSFDGTGMENAGGGVGCGTVAQMKAITPTLAGVGFWATDQACSNFTDLVGQNPTTRTGILGALYKWSGSAWVLHYSPYKYPHELRPPRPPKIPSTTTTVP